MMSLLDAMTPIVRGKCGVCGTCRNLWVSEMTGDGPVACAHADRGCKGTYSVAYAGPKKFLPDELQNVRCRCDHSSNNLPPAGVPLGADELPTERGHGHFNNGLDEEAALRAALAASINGDDELQPEPEPEPEQAAPHPSGELTQEERSLAAKYLQPPADEEVAECSICFDELRLASAAMRCAGAAGRAHYFHAGCLSDWAAQCRSQGNAPSCPDCRGPVQVRRQKLEEFLHEVEQAGGDAQPGLHELAQATDGGDCVDGTEDTWADVKEGLWTAAGVVGWGLAAGAAVAAIGLGVQAIQEGSNRRRAERASVKRGA
jgi:hypothetical protein